MDSKILAVLIHGDMERTDRVVNFNTYRDLIGYDCDKEITTPVLLLFPAWNVSFQWTLNSSSFSLQL